MSDTALSYINENEKQQLKANDIYVILLSCFWGQDSAQLFLMYETGLPLLWWLGPWLVTEISEMLKMHAISLYTIGYSKQSQHLDQRKVNCLDRNQQLVESGNKQVECFLSPLVPTQRMGSWVHPLSKHFLFPVSREEPELCHLFLHRIEGLWSANQVPYAVCRVSFWQCLPMVVGHMEYGS